MTMAEVQLPGWSAGIETGCARELPQEHPGLIAVQVGGVNAQ